MESEFYWYGAKALFKFFFAGKFTGRIEERVIVLKASSLDDALRLAEEYMDDYADENGHERSESIQVCELDQAPVNGSEVFSVLYPPKEESEPDAAEKTER